MKYSELIEVIAKYNLSIRRIPDKVESTFAARSYKEGDTFSENKRFVTRVKIPKNAGKWLVKQVNNSDSMVTWRLEDCLADTLEDSIRLVLNKMASTSKK